MKQFREGTEENDGVADNEFGDEMQTHKGEKSICLPNNNYKCAKLASTLQKQEPSSCEDANSTFHHVIDVVDDSPKKGHLSRTQSSHDQCRVCQQDKEEVLINLGCKCKGGLSQSHRSCIDAWFRTRGSNKCEICQEVAVNVPPPPETQPSTNYWVWRTDPTLRSRDPERGCFSPLWVAFSILVGGLLLDVLISITLGVSALPVNIIIGVIVVLGLGTALRLAVEFCHDWNSRRVVQRVDTNVPLGYQPAL